MSPEYSADPSAPAAGPDSAEAQPAIEFFNGNPPEVNGTAAETPVEAPIETVPGDTVAEAPVEPIQLQGDNLASGGLPEHVGPTEPVGPTEHAEQVRNTISEWVVTVLLLLFLTTTQVQAFVIPSGSMEDTLLIGDHLLVDKAAYAPSGPISKYILPYTEPKRGDIIVFRYPTDIQQTFVKRCMGVPGDHIRIVNKVVYLNGKPLVEPYKYDKTDYIEDYRDNFPSEPNGILEPGGIAMLEHNVVNGEVVVPPGNYFAMGDNRENSLDSRYWGFVPRQNIIGKPLVIYWSYDRPGDQSNTNSITVPQMLDLARHFFSKTRWHRSFQLIHGYPVQ